MCPTAWTLLLPVLISLATVRWSHYHNPAAVFLMSVCFFFFLWLLSPTHRGRGWFGLESARRRGRLQGRKVWVLTGRGGGRTGWWRRERRSHWRERGRGAKRWGERQVREHSLRRKRRRMTIRRKERRKGLLLNPLYCQVSGEWRQTLTEAHENEKLVDQTFFRNKSYYTLFY